MHRRSGRSVVLNIHSSTLETLRLPPRAGLHDLSGAKIQDCRHPTTPLVARRMVHSTLSRSCHPMGAQYLLTAAEWKRAKLVPLKDPEVNCTNVGVSGRQTYYRPA